MKFDVLNPTRVVFGAGRLADLGALAKPYGSRALLVTGGGSVKRNGTFERAVASLNQAGVEVVECSGVEPNPKIGSVRKGIATALDEGCDLVVALGGGSVMDAAKVIAAGVLYEGDPWDMIFHGQPNPYIPFTALPLIAVPTLAATGSEMNCGAVISDPESQVKSFASTEALYPKLALLDPELTLSVPRDQTAYGIADLITHVTEGYFNSSAETPLQDRLAEGVILTAMQEGRKVLADGSDLAARAQIQWAATLALNGWVSSGNGGVGFPVHMLEHTVSAYHDITHAAGLTIINPAWMRFAAKARPAKFVQFAERIFALQAKGSDDLDCALEGIQRFEAFLTEIGCPTRFSQLGIDDQLFETYARETLRIVNDGQGRLPGLPPMSAAQIVDVLRDAS